MLEKEIQLAVVKQDRYARLLAGASAAEREKVLTDIFNDEEKPFRGKLRERQADLIIAVQNGSDTDIAATADDLKTELTKAYNAYDTLPIEQKKHLIGLLVDSVVVLTADGITSNECLILFRWADMQTDVLVTWRGEIMDRRPWTAEEDAAITELWTSASSYSDISARLQPGRKFFAVRRRAIAIKATGEGGRIRKESFAKQAQRGDESWHEQHPKVMYLILSNWTLGSDLARYQEVHYNDEPCWTNRMRSAPREILKQVQVTLAQYFPEGDCVELFQNPVWRDRPDRVASACRYGRPARRRACADQ